MNKKLRSKLRKDIRNDPVKFVKVFWPEITLYKEQREILYSVRDNKETVVSAGNKLGKDFVTALACIWFFMTRHPVRIVTTSTDSSQLEAVLWGEVKRLIDTSKYPLDSNEGGPIYVKHLHLRKIVGDKMCGVSYMIGRVTAKGEGMQGHHVTPESGTKYDPTLPRTLYVCDEASGVDQESYEKASTWASRKLVIGNPWDCDNFFKWAIEGRTVLDDNGEPREIPGGDIPNEDKPGTFIRKTFELGVEVSPNIRLAIAQKKKGLPITGEILIPGVKPYDEYREQLKLWDPIQICVCLNGRFYKGSDVRLYPDHLITKAKVKATKPYDKKPTHMGIDTGQGTANTVWTLGNKYGITQQIAKRTKDTSVIPDETIRLIRTHNIDPKNVGFDLGGGGKEHADQVRKQGYPVQLIAFGGSVVTPPKSGINPLRERQRTSEEQKAFKNRRAQIFWLVRELLIDGYAIPGHLSRLLFQMSKVPILYDKDGMFYMLPKTKKEGSNEKTLIDVIGYSPDELDSFGILAFLLLRSKIITRVG